MSSMQVARLVAGLAGLLRWRGMRVGWRGCGSACSGRYWSAAGMPWCRSSRASSAEAALDLYRSLGDRPGEASVLLCLGAVRVSAGDYADAAAQFAEALRIYRELGSRPGQASALGNLGEARREAGDITGATTAMAQALDIFRDLGDRDGAAEILNETGTLQRDPGGSGRPGTATGRPWTWPGT